MATILDNAQTGVRVQVCEEWKMSIEQNGRGYFNIICDICGEQTREYETFRDAVDAKKDEGFRSNKTNGDGLHTLAVPSPEDTSLAKRYSKCQIINYCPMCGKPLEEVANER